MYWQIQLVPEWTLSLPEGRERTSSAPCSLVHQIPVMWLETHVGGEREMKKRDLVAITLVWIVINQSWLPLHLPISASHRVSWPWRSSPQGNNITESNQVASKDSKNMPPSSPSLYHRCSCTLHGIMVAEDWVVVSRCQRLCCCPKHFGSVQLWMQLIEVELFHLGIKGKLSSGIIPHNANIVDKFQGAWNSSFLMLLEIYIFHESENRGFTPGGRRFSTT